MKLPAGMLVVPLIALAACNPQPQNTHATPAASPTASGLPPLQITGHGTRSRPVSIGAQNGNRKVYQLVAKSYTSRSVQSIAQANFQQATVTFYDKDGTKLSAQAPAATIDDKNKLVTLTGGVHAKTSTGLNMVCDRLTYDQKSGMLHGVGNVRITGMQGGQQQVLTGNDFTSDVKLTQMVIH
jgi:LPS export ABC transporter protein LptC